MTNAKSEVQSGHVCGLADTSRFALRTYHFSLACYMRSVCTEVANKESIPHAASSETFSPNAIGVGAINAVPTFAPTPMALGLNVKPLIHDRVRYK